MQGNYASPESVRASLREVGALFRELQERVYECARIRYVQFDPITIAALEATLLARAAAGQFTFTTVPTTQWFVQHYNVNAPRPVTSNRVVITWSAVYRSPVRQVMNPDGVTVAYVTGGVQRSFGPESIVVDAAQTLIGQGLLLQHIQFCFDSHDQSMKNVGLVPQRLP